MVLLFYTTYISVDLAHHEIFCAKVGKGGIMSLNCFEMLTSWFQKIFCSFFRDSMAANHQQVANLNMRVIDCKGSAGFT